MQITLREGYLNAVFIEHPRDFEIHFADDIPFLGDVSHETAHLKQKCAVPKSEKQCLGRMNDAAFG